MEINNFTPAISIIIPLYNAEKFIRECIESISVQTFQNYEVIIVDDCSTDKSREVVEKSVAEFFENPVEKIRLIELEKNSGGASKPRNIGLKLARGEYIMFIDSDDAITPTALEELYTTAKHLDSDVLFNKRFYMFHGKSWKKPTKISVRGSDVKSPVQITDPVLRYSKHQFLPMVWVYFFKRELIVENKIEFPEIPITEDTFFVLFTLFFAKKVFFISKLYYYYRKHSASIQRFDIPAKYLKMRTESAIRGLQILEDFDKQTNLFKDKPEVRYEIFNRVVLGIMKSAVKRKVNEKISIQEFQDIIQNALDKIEAKDSLTTFLFIRLTELRVELREKETTIKELQEQIEKLQGQNQN